MYSLTHPWRSWRTRVCRGYSRSKTHSGEHPVSISECLSTSTPQAFTPDWLLSFSSSHPLEHPSASLSLLMMFLPSLSHQRFSLVVLVILPVIRTAQSVGSHLECLTQKTVRPQGLLRLQQTFNSCLKQVPMLLNIRLLERQKVCGL